MEMPWFSLIDVATVVAAGAGAGLTLLAVFIAKSKQQTVAGEQVINGPAFLFDGTTLIDATPDGQAIIADHTGAMNDLDAVVQTLAPHFPGLEKALTGRDDSSNRVDGSGADGLWVEIKPSGDRCRLVIKGHKTASGAAPSEIIQRKAAFSERAMLRDMAAQTPQLIWHQHDDGRLLWANRAYLALHDQVYNQSLGQTGRPALPLFPDLRDSSGPDDPAVQRHGIKVPKNEKQQWFDITSKRRDDGFLHFATDATPIVQADHERRQFVQTLSKTFADLSIGLAIFNKERELSMFNPALLDMTDLPIEFLSRRPRLDAVLDRLRETRMLPEPRNYATWRDHFSALEAAAKNGSYSEVWNLPEGQTYRVTGRPHPDGAFAFLFEDISAEMSLTRRFRTDIEAGQAALDTLPDAIAVFSSVGTMMMSNTAYAKLWGGVSAEQVMPHALPDAAHIWQLKSTTTTVWAALHEFIHTLGPRKPWSEQVVLHDGRHIRCHANPLEGGMTMIRFSVAAPERPVISKLTPPEISMRIARR